MLSRWNSKPARPQSMGSGERAASIGRRCDGGCASGPRDRRASDTDKATMKAEEAQRAVIASMSTASALGLRVDDAVVLHDSNRLVVHLLPCDVLARVAPVAHQVGAALELEVARWLTEADSPVARLEQRVEPRVYVRDRFAITLWMYYEPAPVRGVWPREY